MKNTLPSHHLQDRGFSDRSLDRFYNKVDGTALHDVARLFGEMETFARVKADDWDRRNSALTDSAKRHKTVAALGDVVAGLIAGGATFDQAIRHMEALGFPYETILAHWRIYQRRQKRIDRARRDHLILRLYRAGHSDPDIGRRVELHPKTVNSIIQRELRRA